MMKKAAIVFVPLAAALGLLLLNLRETDQYSFGSETQFRKGVEVERNDGAFHRIFPDARFVHACGSCGECVHPLEILENRRQLRMRDHDGWYKLFWAEDEVYFYDDPVHLLGDWGENRTAESPEGRWTLRVRAGKPTHGSSPAHDCGQMPLEIAVDYDLVFSTDPLDETFHSGDGPLKIPETFSWLVYQPRGQVALGWRLSGAPRVLAGRCPCSTP